jgi:glycosyltransferase involved in cell wall biosynthesis
VQLNGCRMSQADNKHAALKPLNRMMLLMTCGGRLENWERQGLIDRELMYYGFMLDAGLNHVDILDYGSGRTQKKIDSRFHALPKKWLHNEILYSLIALFIYWANFRKAQIIKTNQSYGAWVGVLARLFQPGKKLVVRCGWVRTEEMMRKDEKKSGFWLLVHKLAEWQAFRFGSAIIVASDVDRDYVASHYHVNRNKIMVIKNSVDTARYFPRQKSINKKADEFRIVLIGRLVPMKNFQNVIRAAAELDSSVVIQILGDGEFRPELEELAKSHSVNVLFESFIPNDQVPEVLAQADLFVLPQWYASGMPKVTLEAMACGVLTLTTDILTHRQIVQHGRNGFLCGQEVNDLRDAIKTIMQLSSVEKEQIRKVAMDDVAAHHNMGANAAREYRFLQSLANGVKAADYLKQEQTEIENGSDL